MSSSSARFVGVACLALLFFPAVGYALSPAMGPLFPSVVACIHHFSAGQYGATLRLIRLLNCLSDLCQLIFSSPTSRAHPRTLTVLQGLEMPSCLSPSPFCRLFHVGSVRFLLLTVLFHVISHIEEEFPAASVLPPSSSLSFTSLP